MQKLQIVSKLLILLIISIFFNSCASSSYIDRYGTSATKNESTKNRDNLLEDEIRNATSDVKVSEVNEVIDKIRLIVEASKKKQKFLSEIVSYLNTPYQWGGASRRGIDCSAFTQKVYKNSLNVNIPRTARQQYKSWKVLNNKSNLKFGDLIYFNTSKKYFPGHVGIYLEDNLFAHASSSKGVIISSLANKYYSNRFVGANRVKIIRSK